MDLIPRDWKLPDTLRSRFGDEGGRQRALFAEGHLLLVLHEVPKVFGMQLISGLEHVASPWLFWIVLAIGVVIGLVMKAMIAQPGAKDEAATHKAMK